MGEIECLACGKVIKPQQLNDTDNYDTENYDGEVVCQECKSRLHVKSVKGKVQRYKIVEKKCGDFNFTETVMHLAEERKSQGKEGQ